MQTGDRASVLQSLSSFHSLLSSLPHPQAGEQSGTGGYLPGWRLPQETKLLRGAAQGRGPGLLGNGVKAWRVGDSWPRGVGP